MGLSKLLAAQSDNKLIIPYAGKMFRSSISKHNKALCFVINKGYFESASLDEMLILVDSINDADSIVKVGGIEKVHIFGSKTILYRQRLFFKSLKVMLGLCKTLGLRIELADSFRVSINNIMNCTDELIYLERYASRYNQTIDEWLTNCCIIHLNYLLLSMNMYSDLAKRTNKILKGKIGYLDRAPFLVSSYNIDSKSSGIFLEADTSDDRLYTSYVDTSVYLTYGYTTQNINSDVKGGVFK